MNFPRLIAHFCSESKPLAEKYADGLGLGQKLLYGVGGGLAAGIPAYALARMQGAKDSEHARNMGFGAGVATGVAAPRIIQSLYDIARNAGMVPPENQIQEPRSLSRE